MPKYLLLKHYTGGPERHPDFAPISEWTEDEITAHLAFQRHVAELLRERGEFVDVQALSTEGTYVRRTDCPQILAWYDDLLELTDNPLAALSRAVAVGEVDGSLAGLAAAEELATRLGNHHRLDAVRARLHERAGHLGIATEHYTRAAAPGA